MLDFQSVAFRYFSSVSFPCRLLRLSFFIHRSPLFCRPTPRSEYTFILPKIESWILSRFYHPHRLHAKVAVAGFRPTMDSIWESPKPTIMLFPIFIWINSNEHPSIRRLQTT
ncbi:hypothetical protein HRI_000007800 [Hibiscus trionum]|uniref:Uncharacterized protein n=1 Tax=Hibiscus trionum TaxID=183268 RepID=A0A9W7GPH5_HIBTR|nr:hypothetical protein HRI_000007800 [Hibiscus trionum]